VITQHPGDDGRDSARISWPCRPRGGHRCSPQTMSCSRSTWPMSWLAALAVAPDISSLDLRPAGPMLEEIRNLSLARCVFAATQSRHYALAEDAPTPLRQAGMKLLARNVHSPSAKEKAPINLLGVDYARARTAAVTPAMSTPTRDHVRRDMPNILLSPHPNTQFAPRSWALSYLSGLTTARNKSRSKISTNRLSAARVSSATTFAWRLFPAASLCPQPQPLPEGRQQRARQLAPSSSHPSLHFPCSM